GIALALQHRQRVARGGMHHAHLARARHQHAHDQPLGCLVRAQHRERIAVLGAHQGMDFGLWQVHRWGRGLRQVRHIVRQPAGCSGEASAGGGSCRGRFGPANHATASCWVPCPAMAPTSPPAGAPRWYFGWNIVAAATVLTLLTVGMRMGIGPFFLPMAQDLGFSRSLLSAMIAVGMLLYGLGLPLAGHLAAVRGTRFVLLLGTAVTVASLAWTVVTREPVSFFLAFGVCASLGLAFTSQVALTPVLSRWFVRRRGTALFFL